MSKALMILGLLVVRSAEADDTVIQDPPADEICSGEAQARARSYLNSQLNPNDAHVNEIDQKMLQLLTACYEEHKDLGQKYFADLVNKYFIRFRDEYIAKIKAAKAKRPVELSASLCFHQGQIQGSKRDIKKAYDLARMSGGGVIDLEDIRERQNNIRDELEAVENVRATAKEEKIKLLPCSNPAVKQELLSYQE